MNGTISKAVIKNQWSTAREVGSGVTAKYMRSGGFEFALFEIVLPDDRGRYPFEDMVKKLKPWSTDGRDADTRVSFMWNGDHLEFWVLGYDPCRREMLQGCVVDANKLLIAQARRPKPGFRSLARKHKGTAQAGTGHVERRDGTS